MAESDLHRDLMVLLIEQLKEFFASEARVYVSGNLLIYYEEGNPRKQISPDVFVVRGVAKHRRLYYQTWVERKNPNVVIELTSKTTKREDTGKKLVLYRDVLRVREYLLFDPNQEYLDPPLQGYRLVKGEYAAIRPTRGRLVSRELGLHLEAHGAELRLFDPKSGKRLPTPQEALAQANEAMAREAEARRQSDEARRQSDEARAAAVASLEHESRSRRQAEAELERMRAELAALKGTLGRPDGSGRSTG
jgi:Uma2 family endonuclease